jgi:signal transduction histidine kinase
MSLLPPSVPILANVSVAAPKAASSEAGVIGVPEVVKPRILVIEGSAERRARICALLDAVGMEMDEAQDADEGVARASAHAPDLVLLDDDVRDFNSGAAVRRLRIALQRNHVPLIVHGTPMERADCESAGCDGFLDGPLESEGLPQLLRAYLFNRQDVTLAKKLEREAVALTSENLRLREQLRLRNDFLQNLAHELATPLTPLAGYLKLMRSGRLGTLSDRQQQVAEAMTHATERLGRSIDNLVDYASLETGEYRIHAIPMELTGVVDQVVAEFHPRARDKHLRVDVRKPVRVDVSADERRIRQALSNLLDNAIRVSPHGGHVLVEVSEQPESVRIVIYDQGPGVPAEVKRMHEGEPIPRRAESVGGAGLGLPVSRQIAEAHGGGLILESPPAAQPEVRDAFPGSRIGFWIPRHAAA